MTAKAKPKTEGAQFVKYFGPLLDALRGLGDSGTPEEVVERIAKDLGISDEVQNELLPSSGASRFRNQVHWARFYLVREGLVAASKRGVWSLTENGRNKHLTNEEAREIFLKWVKIFQDQRRQKTISNEPVPANITMDVATEAGYRSQVLEVIMTYRLRASKNCPSGFSARLALLKSRLPDAAGTKGLTVMELCKSIPSFHSKCYFNASATESQ